MNTENELHIIEKAKADPSAFGPLYQKYHEQVFRFVYRRIDCPELAADITSDIFVKILLALPKFTYKGLPFAAWLMRIASNTLIDYFRSKASERTISVETIAIQKILSEEIQTEEDNESMELLLSAMSQLKEKDLLMLEMRFFEGHSFREIGDILNLSEVNAKIKTYRILKKLKLKMLKT